MLPSSAQIVICPYCKEEKPLLRLMSGNTIGGKQWSDLKSDYPMLPKPSAVQKCPRCGKYFFLSNAEKKEGQDYSMELGELTFDQAKEALAQFQEDSLSVQNEISLRLLFVHKYNDTFQREHVSKGKKPSAEDMELFEQQVLRLIQIWDIEPLIKAELYREIGDFEKCLVILGELNENDSFRNKIAEKIKTLAQNRKTYAFIIDDTL